jgi:hypothetical protein
MGAAAPASADRDLSTLEPGDAIAFWPDGDHVVVTVFQCEETVGAHTYRWRWMFLDDGSLLECSADGEWRYTEHELLPQGSKRYEELVGPGGALELFEARVRDSTADDEPVLVRLRGRDYSVASTGTVHAERRGAEPGLMPWTCFVSDPNENVYFGLADTSDQSQGAVGIWTTHVCVSFGGRLTDLDIDRVYRRQA